MIPDTWTNYLVPVSCPSTYNYLTTSQKSLNAGYTMGLPKDCLFLSKPKAAWTGDCKNLDMKYSCELDFSLDSKDWISADSLENKKTATSDEQSQLKDLSVNCSCHSNSSSLQLEDLLTNRGCHSNINSNEDLLNGSELHHQKHDKNALNHEVIKDTESGTRHRPGRDAYIHGFIGYFTSVLYKDIIIDTRHTSGNRNSFHWECYFVPLSTPVLVKPDTQVKLRMKRNCEEYSMEGSCSGLKLWYEWQVLVGEKNCLDFSNVSEHKAEDKWAKLSNKPAKPRECSFQDQHRVPKLSEEDSSSEERSCKERNRQCSRHKFSIQNRNGESDSVFLTWEKI